MTRRTRAARQALAPAAHSVPAPIQSATESVCLCMTQSVYVFVLCVRQLLSDVKIETFPAVRGQCAKEVQKAWLAAVPRSSPPTRSLALPVNDVPICETYCALFLLF